MVSLQSARFLLEDPREENLFEEVANRFRGVTAVRNCIQRARVKIGKFEAESERVCSEKRDYAFERIKFVKVLKLS